MGSRGGREKEKLATGATVQSAGEWLWMFQCLPIYFIFLWPDKESSSILMTVNRPTEAGTPDPLLEQNSLQRNGRCRCNCKGESV